VSSVFEQPWTGRHLLVTQRLRHRRDELGLTQKQVVTRLARVGVMTTNRALSSLEHGAGLDVAKLPELAHVLDCTVTYLVGLTDDPRSWAPDPETTTLLAGAPRAERPDQRAHHADPNVPPHAGLAPKRESCILGADIPDRTRRMR
jgi:transcriptional regulator with XRE-family HTH domain